MKNKWIEGLDSISIRKNVVIIFLNCKNEDNNFIYPTWLF